MVFVLLVGYLQWPSFLHACDVEAVPRDARGGTRILRAVYRAYLSKRSCLVGHDSTRLCGGVSVVKVFRGTVRESTRKQITARARVEMVSFT